VARGGVALQAVISEAGWSDPALQRLACRAAAVAIVPQALLNAASSLESPSPLAYLLPWPAQVEARPGEAAVVLDRLQDPGNVGAILRSAAAFGFGQVLALKGTAALWSTKVVRAGMGAHFGLHLVEGLDAAALEPLALPLLATSSHAAEALDAVRLPWPCAWVIGHEGGGVAPALLERCRQTLRIPQPGGEESLNAAAAAAICLYESTRQRAMIDRRLAVASDH
jgi:TrmH family RNA methyltransferase